MFNLLKLTTQIEQISPYFTIYHRKAFTQQYVPNSNVSYQGGQFEVWIEDPGQIVQQVAFVSYNQNGVIDVTLEEQPGTTGYYIDSKMLAKNIAQLLMTCQKYM